MKAHTPRTLVLCEGKDDRLVMESLATHASLGNRLEFQDYGGETNLRRNLATLKVSPEFTRGEYAKILVTRDADTDFNSAWQSVADSIQAVFSQMPSDPGDWLLTENGVKISAWIIPGPGKSGMIETLFLDAARSGNPEMFTCLDPFMECLEKLHGDTPHEKVRFALWTVIAQGQGAQDRLSLPLAIKRIRMDWDDEAFASLKGLLAEVSA